MRSVLIDQDQTVLVLRDQIGVEALPDHARAGVQRLKLLPLRCLLRRC